MLYIGIDPSTKTGLVVLDKDGRVLTGQEVTTKGKDPKRMSDIVGCVAGGVNLFAKEAPVKIAIEGFGFATQQGIQLGGYGWGIRCKLYEMGLQYIEVAPTALKKFTGAKGNAKKDIIRLEVYKRWGFEHASDNVVDAYVLAQIARHIGEGLPVTKFQDEVIKNIKKGVA